jgi:hypothetical protein
MCFKPEDSIARLEHERPDPDLEQPPVLPGSQRSARGNPELDLEELARAEEKLASVVGQKGARAPRPSSPRAGGA